MSRATPFGQVERTLGLALFARDAGQWRRISCLHCFIHWHPTRGYGLDRRSCP